nr:MAG TPA: hypothetical protein [Caudoviricetes sp.]
MGNNGHIPGNKERIKRAIAQLSNDRHPVLAGAKRTSMGLFPMWF